MNELWNLWSTGVRYWLDQMDKIMDPQPLGTDWRYHPPVPEDMRIDEEHEGPSELLLSTSSRRQAPSLLSAGALAASPWQEPLGGSCPDDGQGLPESHLHLAWYERPR